MFQLPGAGLLQLLGECGLTRDVGVLQACRHLPLVYLQLQGVHLINVPRDSVEHRVGLTEEDSVLPWSDPAPMLSLFPLLATPRQMPLSAGPLSLRPPSLFPQLSSRGLGR